MRAAGFHVYARDRVDMPALSVPDSIASCHTAVVDGYVIEGDVPAETILRLLRERPAVAGIAVRGMPPGSPGMETGTREPFDVVTFGGGAPSRIYDSRAGRP